VVPLEVRTEIKEGIILEWWEGLQLCWKWSNEDQGKRHPPDTSGKKIDEHSFSISLLLEFTYRFILLIVL
jgi:hypothetical protein